jgi:hypothetical protein
MNRPIDPDDFIENIRSNDLSPSEPATSRRRNPSLGEESVRLPGDGVFHPPFDPDLVSEGEFQEVRPEGSDQPEQTEPPVDWEAILGNSPCSAAATQPAEITPSIHSAPDPDKLSASESRRNKAEELFNDLDPFPPEVDYPNSEGSLPDPMPGLDDSSFIDQTAEELKMSTVNGQIYDSPDEPRVYVHALEAQLTADDAIKLGINDISSDSVIASSHQMMETGTDETVFLRADYRPKPAFRDHIEEYRYKVENGIPMKNKTGSGLLNRILNNQRWILPVIGIGFMLLALETRSPTLLMLCGGLFMIIGVSGWLSTLQDQPDAKQQPDQKPELTDSDRARLKLADEKGRSHTFAEVSVRLVSIGKNDSDRAIQAVAQALSSNLSGSYQDLQWAKVKTPLDAVLGLPSDATVNLSDDEMSRFLAPPDDDVLNRGVNITRSVRPVLPEVMPVVIDDPRLPAKGIVSIGYLDTGEGRAPIGLENAGLDTHAWITGGTGTGKSTLATHYINGLVRSDYPVVLLDPHGALAMDVIELISLTYPERIDDIVLVDLKDEDHVAAINPLDIQTTDDIDDAVSQVIAMLSSFDTSATPRGVVYAELMLSAMCEANLLLPAEEKLSLLHCSPFFRDAELRHQIVELSSDPRILAKFDVDDGDFEKLSEKEQLEHIQAIIRAFDGLLKNRRFSRFFSTINRLDLPCLIKQNKIILLKLDAFGGANSNKLGEIVASMMMPMVMRAMNDNALITDGGKQGVRIVVDEAPAVIQGDEMVEGIVRTLAEARKYDAGLTLISQYPKQFPAALREGLFANVYTKIALNTGANSVAGLDKAMSGGRVVTAKDLGDLPPYHAYANFKVQRGGQKQDTGPFLITTLPPLKAAKGSNASRAVLRSISRVRSNSRLLVSIPVAEADQRIDESHSMETIKETLQALLRARAAEQPDQTPAPLITDPIPTGTTTNNSVSDRTAEIDDDFISAEPLPGFDDGMKDAL